MRLRVAVVLLVPAVIATYLIVNRFFPAPPADPAPPAVTAPGELPIVNQPTELTGFIPSGGFIADISTNAAMRTVEARTGVTVDWTESSKLNARDELSLLLAGESYPEIIQGAGGSGLSTEDLVQYGTEGIFLPLNDLIAEHGFFITQMFEALPGLEEAITASDGNIYGLPAVITDDYHMTMRQKLWINRAWLDRLGLQEPTNTAEFLEVMTAFRDRDANGNGDPDDEIPMTGARRNLEDLAMWIMNAFVPAGGADGSGDARLNSYEFIRDGVVTFSANTPEFREGLRYIRGLYTAGLIDVAAFTQDRMQITPLVDGGDEPRVGAVASHHPGNFATIGDDPDLPFRQYVALPPIAGPSGARSTPWFSDVRIEQGQFVITRAARSPEVAIRFADYYYSLEFAEIEKGIEGVHWRRTLPGENLPAIDGGIARYQYLETLDREDNAQINLGPVWTRRLKNQFARSTAFSYEQMLYDATLPYAQYRVRIFPYDTISVPADSIEEFNDLRRTIHTYIGDSVDRFIIGALDIDSDWDAYVRHLNRLGLPRYLELLHTAWVHLGRRSP